MKAREFAKEVKLLSKKYNLPFFFVTDGASMTSNNGCEAISEARKHHIEWEKKNGIDPEHNWNEEE